MADGAGEIHPLEVAARIEKAPIDVEEKCRDTFLSLIASTSYLSYL